MERAILIGGAVLLVAYFVLTEILDWVGRMDVIRQYVPKFPESLERRSFRVVLLVVAIALLIRVVAENKGEQSRQVTEVQKTDNPASQSKSADSPQSNGATGSNKVAIRRTPQNRVTAKVEHKLHAVIKDGTPSGATSAPPSPSQSCPNGICIGGENSGTATVNNFGSIKRSIAPADRAALVHALTKIKAKGAVRYVISAEDAGHFAFELNGILRDAGWEMAEVRAVQGEMPPGVRIGCHGDTRPNGPVLLDDNTLQGKVIQALDQAHVKGLYVHSRPQIDDDSIEVIVSSNPD